MKLFAERLKNLRIENSLTQKQLAEILHLKQQSYLRYELNTGEPSLETLAAIARNLNVSTDYLLGLED